MSETAWHPKFLLCVIGRGEGCDYTIGCNLNFHELSSQTKEGARIEAKAHLGEEYYGDLGSLTGCRIQAAELFEVSSKEELPLNTWRRDSELAQNKKEIKREEAAEKQEYERLKKKYAT